MKLQALLLASIVFTACSNEPETVDRRHAPTTQTGDEETRDALLQSISDTDASNLPPASVEAGTVSRDEGASSANLVTPPGLSACVIYLQPQLPATIGIPCKNGAIQTNVFVYPPASGDSALCAAMAGAYGELCPGPGLTYAWFLQARTGAAWLSAVYPGYPLAGVYNSTAHQWAYLVQY